MPLTCTSTNFVVVILNRAIFLNPPSANYHIQLLAIDRIRKRKWPVIVAMLVALLDCHFCVAFWLYYKQTVLQYQLNIKYAIHDSPHGTTVIVCKSRLYVKTIYDGTP